MDLCKLNYSTGLKPAIDIKTSEYLQKSNEQSPKVKCAISGRALFRRVPVLGKFRINR
ncbi:hypothetical protein Hanom_Chr05g00467101 [Helianthus anomalus]